MIEKSFTAKKIAIDQVNGYIDISPNPQREQVLVKRMFDDIEVLAEKAKPIN